MSISTCSGVREREYFSLDWAIRNVDRFDMQNEIGYVKRYLFVRYFFRFDMPNEIGYVKRYVFVKYKKYRRADTSRFANCRADTSWFANRWVCMVTMVTW